MSIRHCAQRVLVAIAATAALGGFGALAFSSAAGATGPSSGSIVPNAAQPTGNYTPGPFSSGQNINVVIPANNTFSSTDGLEQQQLGHQRRRVLGTQRRRALQHHGL